MEQIYDFTLFFHVFSGGIALLSGIIAIATRKGGQWHTKSGLLYFWSMLLVIATGFYVGWVSQNFYLQMIAIFSFYMAFTGKRSLRNKSGFSLNRLDLVVSIIGLVLALIMISLGLRILMVNDLLGSAPMLLVFGGILGTMSGEDFWQIIKKKAAPGGWLVKHIGRMGGSFIATSTAFLLVNIKVEPAWIVWLSPTVIGSIMISVAISRLRIKMSRS